MPMVVKKVRFASVLLGLVMALALMPGLAIAVDTDSGAAGGGFQTAAAKPSQAIQATRMSVFTTDTGKNLGAKVVEGDGALSYAVKSGSEQYIGVDSNGALTFKAAPPDNIAYITVTAAETAGYAATSVDVPAKIYEHFDYDIYFQDVQYAIYNNVYNLESLDITLFDKGGKEVGKTTVENPRRGNSVTISATNFVDRTEMTAHIKLPRRDPFTLTGSSGVGGAINVWNKTSYTGRCFTCNYGTNAPDPEYTAPVAKTNLAANGQNQILIHKGSVSVGGNMEYNLGTKEGPNWNQGFGGLGYIRAANPGTYYVWWRTHNTDFYTSRYIGQGRSEVSPQCIEATIGRGTISPTVSIEGWPTARHPRRPPSLATPATERWPMSTRQRAPTTARTPQPCRRTRATTPCGQPSPNQHPTTEAAPPQISPSPRPPILSSPWAM